MASSNLVELAKTTTADGLRLDGIWYSPAAAGSHAVICLHGAGSNFYAGGLWERMVVPLVERGWGVLRVNTRGHDGYFAARTAAGPVRLGAAYEIVAECSLDIAAWVQWLVGRGVTQIALLGHSLGAIKAIYSQATEPDSRVAQLVAISPPRLSCSAFRNGPQSHDFQPTLHEAERLVREGNPRAVLESRFPFPMLISAEAYVDKYGAERYNIVELVSRLTTPITFVYGQLELEGGSVAFAGLPDAINGRRRSEQRLDVRTIGDADHFYVGRFDALNESVLAALEPWGTGVSGPLGGA